MKKLFLMGVMLLAFTGISSGQKISVATGVWKGMSDVCLYSVNNGTLKTVAVSKTDSEGRFAFGFLQEEEGFYVIGNQAGGRALKYAFYFKPGDRLDVEMSDLSYKLTGKKNTKENVEMEKWHNFIGEMERISFYFQYGDYRIKSYVDFFPLLEEKAAELPNYEQGYKKNKVFNNAFAHFMRYDFAYTAINIILTPRTAHPHKDDYPEWYQTLNVTELSGDELLKYPYGMTLLGTFTTSELMFSKKPASEIPASRSMGSVMDFYLPKIQGQVVKGEFALSRISSFKTYYDLVDFNAKYGKYLVTDSQKERFKTVFEDAASKVGSPATDFTFEDINGKKVSLSDYKGKAAVYIDVWATWCGPCRGEIPHLKKLEAEYHGNDQIVFMSVSTDKAKDYDTWKKMVLDEQLGGVQLFSGDKAGEIVNTYKVTGIPRFIMVGKSGNIVSPDAPRPSSGDQIRKLIEEAIKK